MFFPERILSIKEQDRILEIGPGATPHPKASVFLEKKFNSKSELIAQSGHVGILETDKELIYYDGNVFPFEDKEFDYVICSHVLEHVDDVPLFLNEIFRVGKRGYLEFPTIYYDYLHNIEEHLNMLLYKNGEILWCKKSETPIPELVEFTNFFRKIQHQGFRFQNEINALWHQGFEWYEPVPEKKVLDWKSLTYSKNELEEIINSPKPRLETYAYRGVKSSAKQLVKEILHKIGLRR